MKKYASLLLLFVLTAMCSHAQIITTIAGGGTSYPGDGGPATAASLGDPMSIALDGSCNIYIAELSHRASKVNAAGIITTIAGDDTTGYKGDGGPATAAWLSQPHGIAVDGAGNVYISDGTSSAGKIRKVNASGIISTIFGGGTLAFAEGSPATAIKGIGFADGVAVDNAGNVYLCSSFHVYKINTAGIINSFAGSAATGFSGDGGPATAAVLSHAEGITIDGAGNVYFSDNANHTVRKVNTSGIITTVAGIGGAGYSGDGGPATLALLSNPDGIAIDVAGNLYINDAGNSRVRKVNTAGIITTIAGVGTVGDTGDGGPAISAEFNNLTGLAVDCHGNLYIGEEIGQRVRKITYSHTPNFTGGSHSLMACQNSATSINAVLSVMDIDTGQTVNWSVVTAPAHGTLAGMAYNMLTTGGTIMPAGLTYTPSSGYTGSDSFTVVVMSYGAISDTFVNCCGILSDTVTIYVTVNPSPVVATINGVDSVCKGNTITLTNTTSGGVWSATGNVSIGAATGVVTGISTGSATISYTVTALGCSTSVWFPVKVVRCPAGVEPLYQKAEIIIYPNPTNEILNINGVPENTKYRMMNVAGVCLQQGSLNKGVNTLSLRYFAPGVYILEVIAEDGERSMKRVVKE